jgi:hypothetical protein
MAYTNKQAKVAQWLERVNPHSAKLFESAVRLTEDLTLPCRGRFVAHAYREICSGLFNSYSSNSRDDIKPHLDRLASEFGKLTILGDELREPSNGPLEPSLPDVSVSRVFIGAVSAVVKVHIAAPKGRERALAVFDGLASNPKASRSGVSQTADRWFSMYNYFVACVHDRTTDDSEMMSDEFNREVSFFEDTLLSFAEGATTNLDVLDGILEEANS